MQTLSIIRHYQLSNRESVLINLALVKFIVLSDEHISFDGKSVNLGSVAKKEYEDIQNALANHYKIKWF